MKRSITLLFVLLSLLFFCFTALAKDMNVLVRYQTEALDEAKLLGSILTKSLGYTVLIVDDKYGDAYGQGSFMIHVGFTKLAVQEGLDDVSILSSFGYRIKSIDNENIAIVSKSKQGLGYAVYDFLHRFVGYRWFMPGELGEIIPERNELALCANADLIENPSFITFNNALMNGGNQSYLRSSRVTLLATHNLGKIFPPEIFGKDHPEYYPFINGKRVVPPDGSGGQWQPCVSNPDLPEIAVAWARDYFSRNPDRIGFSLGVNDGGGDCHCENCQMLKEQYGNQYIPFYNKVACFIRKEFPDKLVGFIAYGGAYDPPVNIKLEPNLYVEITNPFRDSDKYITGWLEAGAKAIGAYDYLYGAGYIVPRHYPNVLGQKWKQAYEEYGLKGAWLESSTRNWFFDGPRQYVLNNLAWNIYADIDELLDDYFLNFYGEATEPVKNFFAHIEEVYSRKVDPYYPMADRAKSVQLKEYTFADVDTLTSLLQEANAVAQQPQVKKRVHLLTRSFEFSKLNIFIDLYIRELASISITLNFRR